MVMRLEPLYPARDPQQLPLGLISVSARHALAVRRNPRMP
jgi:hypothetical protein